MTSQIVKLYVGDVVRTRKPHPCGGDVWVVERLGADVGIRCRTCGRFALMERVKFERRIRQFLQRGPDRPEPQMPDPGDRAPTSESPKPQPRARSGTLEPSPADRRPRRRIVKRAKGTR
ncbi:MAG: DUF951 domain-containing protein [Armatimonadota bacterium]|nr:DUF951 domain-containing protein [Armatimonadota bacterium]MDR5696765.1 DUF951 domain-containing protein [Armatimonadota bacterium]